MTDSSDIANYKYHSAQVVALSSGQLAVVGPFSNEEGLPLQEVFDNFKDLHEALWQYQQDMINRGKAVYKTQPKVQLSLESLGLAKPLKRRSLNNA